MTMKKGECLHIRISEELKLQAEKIASQSNQTLSDWLRDLIKRAVWREELKKESDRV